MAQKSKEWFKSQKRKIAKAVNVTATTMQATRHSNTAREAQGNQKKIIIIIIEE